MRAKIEAGEKPYSNQLVGFVLGGKKIEEYAPDFWLVSEDGSTPIGYLTSPGTHQNFKPISQWVMCLMKRKMSVINLNFTYLMNIVIPQVNQLTVK